VKPLASKAPSFAEALVLQTSQSAVSPISQSADSAQYGRAPSTYALRVRKPAIQQTWKSAVRQIAAIWRTGLAPTFVRLFFLLILASPLTTPAQTTILTNAFITQLISREYSLDVGGVQTPDIQQLSSREISLSIDDGPANPFSQATSREYSAVIVSAIPPPQVTGITASNSPSGSQVILNWGNYNQWAVGTVAQFNIYYSTTPFNSVAGMTPILTVPAENVSALLSNLPPLEDYYVAVVAVDALGNYISTVYYKGVYIISPQVITREISLAVGNDTPQPQFLQLSSRELSLVVDQATPPPAVANLTTALTPTGSSVTLNWSSYNQWAFGDISQYAIYYSSSPITSLTGLVPYATVPGETFSITLSGLPPWQDHYFAVVPVDAAGNFGTNIIYAGAYPLSPQAISRQLSLSIDNGPATVYSQASSRESSLLITGTNTAGPVTGIGSGFTAVKSASDYDAIDLNWTSYDELLQQDVVRYRIYIANAFFSDVTNMTPVAYVPAGIQTFTLTGLFSSRTYFVAVVAEDGSGNFDPTVYAISAQPSGPNITFNSQPQSQTDFYGASAAFSVAVSGAGPFGYQWLFNGLPLSGQAADNLTLNNLQFANAGGYTVAVTNYYGSVTSSIASLTIVLDTNTPNPKVSQNGGNLVLNWSGPFILQTATNLAGPYSDITGSANSYTNLTGNHPAQFFRLRSEAPNN
jgi:hypothetical protein